MEYEFDENGVVIAVKSKDESVALVQNDDANGSSEVINNSITTDVGIQNNMVDNKGTAESPIIENNEGPEYKFDENGMIIGIVE